MLIDARKELEFSLLSILSKDRKLFDKMNPVLNKNDFGDMFHQNLYELMQELHNKNLDYDHTLLYEEYCKKYKIKERDDFDSINSKIFSSITGLLTYQDIPSMLNRYTKEIKEHSIKYNFSCKLSILLQNSKENNYTVDTLINSMYSIIKDIELSQHNDNSIDFKVISSKITKEIINREKNRNTFKYYQTKFGDLDEIIMGFKKGDFIIIGARPSVGKTALAMHMALNMHVISNIKVAMFSLEMSADSLMYRLLSTFTTIPHSTLQYKIIDDKEKQILNKTCEVFKEGSFINDRSNMDLDILCSEIRKLVIQKNVEVIFIDYLGLISYDYNKFMPRHEQVANVSKTLKNLARILDVPIIALSQLNRDVQDKEPNLFNIRESGAIEQDADMVLLLHKTEDSQEDNRIKTIQINVAKNRNGKIGKCLLNFHSDILRFANYKP